MGDYPASGYGAAGPQRTTTAWPTNMRAASVVGQAIEVVERSMARTVMATWPGCQALESPADGTALRLCLTIMAMALHEASFRAMDTDVDVLIAAEARPEAAFAAVAALFERQEALFSRFRKESALSALNRGRAVADRQFMEACRLALRCEAATGGLFNPMVLPSLESAGYDRTFAEVAGGEPAARTVPPFADSLEFTRETVRLRRGGLDLGGIVKGWTVDLAIGLIEGLGFRDALVNAGGDLRCAGCEPGVAGWQLEVDTHEGRRLWQGPMSGSLATSTSLKRRWTTDSGAAAHHLIDPRTGLPAISPFEQVSVWAPDCWEAEAWAKAILIGGEAGLTRATEAGQAVLAGGPGDEVRRHGR